ncbi:MAG: flagellar hook assembly protein FlgD [Labilithrix sp.]|nr:flagellar hook assembly protein FlgD [Labilithrix sp.]MBX3210411.1 flagellar hook assembly protein FlgD [Labilithrix sp.]
MALSSVTSAAGTNTTPASEPKEKSALDKDAFLKLLVAQLSHQDPLQPTEGTEFVAQLSQFAMVEQSIAQSAKLDVLSAQMTGLASNEAAGLVGKDVTVRGSGIAFDGVTATGSSINLDAPAAKVTVRIQDASGKTVRTLELGPRGAGAVPITWDGKDDAGQPVAKGSYSIKVDATTADGKSVNTSQDVSGKVTKVSFEKGYPELLLDSGVTAPISELVSVGGTVR